MPQTQLLISGLLAFLLSHGSGCASQGRVAQLGHLQAVPPSTPRLEGTSGAQALGALLGTLLVESGAFEWILMAPLLAPFGVLDLLILPVTYEDPFPCTQTVLKRLLWSP